MALVLLLAAAPAGIAQEKEQEDGPLAAQWAQAEEARGGTRARRFADLASAQVEVANRYFGDGEVARGHRAVERAVEAAEKAGEAAVESRRRMKQTEISLRQTARRLDDIRRTLAFEDRPAVESAVESIEDTRRVILDAMFAPRKGRS
jgi:hypothetical protein